MKRTAAILPALMTMAGQAQAMTVSAKVGPLLQQAQTLIAAKNYRAATAKLNEAEAAKANPDDETVINQLRQYVAVASDPTHPHCNSAMGITRCDGGRVQP